LVRTAWLLLLFPVLAKAGHRWLGWQVEARHWLYPTLVAGLLSALWALRPIPRTKLARRLDSRLDLRNRLVTALEQSQVPDPSSRHTQALDPHITDHNPVSQRLLWEAVKIVIALRKRAGMFDLSFWVELQTLIAIVALLVGMFMLDILEPVMPVVDPEGLPPAWQEPTADQIIPPNPTLFPPPFPPNVQVPVLSAEQLGESLQALADALRDQAITRSIAEAIDRGDLAGAAEGLRRLADQLGDLSPEARDGLSDAMGEAAENVGPEPPGLREPLEAGSRALGRDDVPGTSQALEDLAEALDALDSAPQESAQTGPEAGGEPDDASPAGEQEGASDNGADGDGDQPTEEERLAVEGQPLELESDPQEDEQVLQPAELDADPGQERTQDSPFARQPANAAIRDLGPDPLTYPWEKRGVIQRYFTP